MRNLLAVLVVFVFVLSANASPVVDDFNSYGNGLIVDQGGWFDREHGEVFSVEGAVTHDGSTAIGSGNQTAFGIITKTGTPYADGYQSFYFFPEHSSRWASPISFQLGVYQNSWDGPSRAVMNFRSDGHAYHTDSRVGPFVEFGTFQDNTWNSAEIEWRAVDTSARYRVNKEAWTDWTPFTVNPSYSYFDTVGISAIYLGSGADVYIDSLGSPVPEPASLGLLLIGSFLFLRRR